ncbi:MAG: NAD(+)/NADH kinase [Anaerolineales bacterium]
MSSSPSKPAARSPERFAVLANPQIPEAVELAETIGQHLEGEAYWGPLNDDQVLDQIAQQPVDLCIALGGDGTMLRAGHLCAPLKIPILGINLGRFGFLTEVHKQDWEQALSRVVAGDYWLEERMMLRADHLRNDKELGSWEVLNECFIGRGELVRPVDLITEIDERYLTTYIADGLIVATPTGSTAYALAAGGPILPPELRNVVIVPVAPHLSVDRAIVLHEGSSVRVEVRTDHQAILSVDGGPPVLFEDRDRVELRAADNVVHFARLQDPDYFYRNLTSRMNQKPSSEKG